MKIKMEYVVLATLIAVISFYLVFRKIDRNLYELPVMDGIKAADISKIDISRAGTSLELVKKGDKWVVGEKNYPADADEVRELVDSIAGFSVTALISESENYARYDLDADSRIGVKAWTGDRLCRDVYLGKVASSYRHTFVMIAGDRRVYHASGSLRSRFDLQLDDLRDKDVFAVQPDKITGITLAGNGKTVVLTRETVTAQTGGGTAGTVKKTGSETVVWKNSDGKTVNSETIDTLLSSLKDLRCDRFIENQPKESFTSPVYTVTLTDGKKHVLKIFEKQGKEDDGFPAVSSQNDYPFILSKWSADRIMKDPDSLVKKEQ